MPIRNTLILLVVLGSNCSAAAITRPNTPPITEAERERQLAQRRREHALFDAAALRCIILNYEYDRKTHVPIIYEVESRQYSDEKNEYAALKAQNGFSDNEVDAFRGQSNLISHDEQQQVIDAIAARDKIKDEPVVPPKVIVQPHVPTLKDIQFARQRWEIGQKLDHFNSTTAEMERTRARKAFPDIEKAMDLIARGMKQIELNDNVQAAKFMANANSIAPGISDLDTVEAIKKYVDLHPYVLSPIFRK